LLAPEILDEVQKYGPLELDKTAAPRKARYGSEDIPAPLFKHFHHQPLEAREGLVGGHEGGVLPDREGGQIGVGYVVARRVGDQG
jgi:hypothetical protein